MAKDPKLIHAREFTDVETPTLTLWNDLQDAGFRDLAQSVLDSGLMVEHYISLLSDDVAQRTPEQLAQLAKLRETQNAFAAAGRDALNGNVPTAEPAD